MCDEKEIMARLTVLSTIREMIHGSTEKTAWEKLQEVDAMINRGIDHELYILGTNSIFFLKPLVVSEQGAPAKH